jgi:hypothetical protein
MLRKFRRTLDISDCHNLALWTAIVVGFFSFLRASNLVPRGARDFEGVLFLRRSDIKFTDEGVVFKVQDSKTNQFGDRKVRIPIPQITRDALCPMLALQSLFKAVRVIPSLPAFSYALFRWIHYSELLNRVKQVAIVSDVDPLRFGCHSLCRGGATFAAECGVLAFYIKLRGDWSSDCYTWYIALSLEAKLMAPSLMSMGVRVSR